jgi:hypothetical protein
MSPRVAQGFYAARGVLQSRRKEKGKVRAYAEEAVARAETRNGKSLAARNMRVETFWMATWQNLASALPNCWSINFLVLPKKTRIISAISKLLEMLLYYY